MGNKYQDITHLKQGKAIPDPIATAKATGKHFANNTSHNEIHPRLIPNRRRVTAGLKAGTVLMGAEAGHLSIPPLHLTPIPGRVAVSGPHRPLKPNLNST